MIYLIDALGWFIAHDDTIRITLYALLAAACAFLIAHGDYDEGVVGFAGLLLVVIGNLFRIMCIADDLPLYMHTFAAMISLLGWVLFMARHIYRFLQWRWHGKFDWRKALCNLKDPNATHH